MSSKRNPGRRPLKYQHDVRVYREGQEPPPDVPPDRHAVERQRRLFENASLRLGDGVCVPEGTGGIWWLVVDLDRRAATATLRTTVMESPRR
jgi:hypothetical protein